MTMHHCARRVSRQSLCCLAVVALTVALPIAAVAKNEALSRAQALYEAFRYDEAFAAYNEALAFKGNAPDQIATIYLHLGIIAAAMDRPSEASEHFKRVLCLNPQVQLAEGVPPKVLGPFLVAQEGMKQLKRFRLGHTPPTARPANGPFPLDVELEPDSLGLATGVSVRYREVGGKVFMTRSQPGTGSLSIALPPTELRPGHDVEYYLQVDEAHGGVLWEYGSESSPIVVRAAAVPAPVVVSGQGAPAAAAGSGAVRDDGSARRPWYENGWIWVAAGGAAALLVAGGVTTAVAVAAYQSTPVQFGRVSYRIAGE